MPEIRRRIKHFDDHRDAHFLTFSCFHGLPLLSKDRSRLWFVDAVERSRRKFRFHLWAWVAMPNHAHLLLWNNQPEVRTQDILHFIKGSVGKKGVQYLRKHSPFFLKKLQLIVTGKQEYHFWQDGPGHDRNVEDARVIHEQIRYSHENPVKAGLATCPEDWKWCSARAWAGDLKPILRIDFESVPRLVE